MANIRTIDLKCDLYREADDTTLRWFGSESVTISGTVYNGKTKIDLPVGGSCRLDAWSGTTTGVLYINKTGTIDTTASTFTVSLTPEQGNLTAGTYNGVIRIFDSGGTTIIGAVWQGEIVVTATPASAGVGYVGTTGPLNLGELADVDFESSGNTPANGEALIYDSATETWIPGASANTASGVTFSPTGNVAATNVQAAIAEVDSEKLALAGGTMTGGINMGGQTITFVTQVTSPSAAMTITAGSNTLGLTGTGGVTITGNTTLNGNLSPTGTVDGRDVAADGTKLDGIEAAADVTDAANVTSALSGATLTAVTVAGSDKVLVQDASDSDNLKTVTAQSIADLASGSSAWFSPINMLKWDTANASGAIGWNEEEIDNANYSVTGEGLQASGSSANGTVRGIIVVPAHATSLHATEAFRLALFQSSVASAAPTTYDLTIFEHTDASNGQWGAKTQVYNVTGQQLTGANIPESITIGSGALSSAASTIANYYVVEIVFHSESNAATYFLAGGANGA